MKLLVRPLLGAALLARTAAAQQPPPYDVVIVGEASDRLVQDLKTQLAESHIGARIAAPSTAALPEIAETEHVAAVVRVPAAHDELQVWMASWQAGRPLLDLRLKSQSAGDEDALVQQCIELLRESQSSPAEATAAKPPAAAPSSGSDATSRTPPATEPARLRLQLGAAYNFAGSRVRWASLDGALGVRAAHWFALFRGSAPWSPAVVSEPEGRAEVHSSSVGVGAGFCWKLSHWELLAGPIVGARTLRVIGTDTRAEVSSEAAWQFEAGANAALEYRGPVPVFLALRTSFVTPQGRLRFFGEERTSFGPLLVTAELGFALELLD